MSDDADVIVVGAGMLGALLAERLARKGRAVLMLEAGPRQQRGKLLAAFREVADKSSADAFYPDLSYAPRGGSYIESVGPVPFHPSVLRLIGGTTWHWSSAFWRFLPNDFKLRSVYGRGRDWPISYDDLERYYGEVEVLTGCAGSDSDDQSGIAGKPFPPRSTPYLLPPERWSSYTRAVAAKFAAIGHNFIHEPNLIATQPHDGRPQCRGNNNCPPLCPIGAVYTGDRAVAAAEKAGARVLPDTVAVKLEVGAAGKVVAVHTMAPDGTATRRPARVVVLAAHALETPKLLMLSGIGEKSGQVGRNLMTHPSIVWQSLVRDAVWPGRGPTQQGGSVHWRDGPHRAHHAAFKFHVNNNVPNAALAERLLGMGVIGRELDERLRHDAARHVSIIGGMDMLPDPANAVTLGGGRDALGMPTLRVRFDNDAYVHAAAEVMRGDFARLDAAFPTVAMLSDRHAAPRPASAHIMGTTIMGADAATSVVDRDCRVWGHPNLFVASTSVFASASVVNPTLTGAALALRAADRIVADG